MKNESAKAKRSKVSFYLKTEVEEKLIKLFVKRLGKDLRAKKSYLVEEAIELFYKDEFEKK